MYRSLRRRVTGALALTVACAGATPAQQATAPAATIFERVTVLPMDRERTIPDQTVVVVDGRITYVGPARGAPSPAGATRIDGRGKFLMPGLAEMHSHVPPQQPADDLLRDLMYLYVANGVTTIRGMLGAEYQLALRDRLARGEILGPRFIVAAPSLNGNSASDPGTAARLVRMYREAGYDLLKLHPGLSRTAYDSIVAAGRSAGITWAGHISADVGIEHTLATKQSTIDHLDGYIEGSATDAVRARMGNVGAGGVPPAELWRSIDSARLTTFARQTAAAGVWNVPTMYLWETLFNFADADSMARLPEMRYMPRQMVAAWANAKRNRMNQMRAGGITPEDAAVYFTQRRALLKALADAGAPLLMGTDSPQIFNVPGYALHRELWLMRASGLTPWQILESGTRNVARYARELGLDARFGTVEVGNRADLVLLDANPLADLANVTRRAGVMVGGRWIPAAAIDAELEAIAARMAAR